VRSSRTKPKVVVAQSNVRMAAVGRDDSSSMTKAELRRHLVANVGKAIWNGRTFPDRPPSALAEQRSMNRLRARSA
jgi:hypothetical protein